MKDSDKDTGIILALVSRMEKQRLPRALSIKKKLQAGGTFGTSDLYFLEQVFKDGKYIPPLLEKYPEWQPLANKMMGLYLDLIKMHQKTFCN